jgi:hypothetical protein
VYGWGEKKGRTEEITGNWFAKGDDRRDKVALATKVYGNMAADGRVVARPRQALGGQHPAGGRRVAQAAPDRPHRRPPVPPRRPPHPLRGDLAGDRHPDHPGQDPLVRSSNFPGYKIAQANEIAARRDGTIGLVSEQCLDKLAERRAGKRVFATPLALRLSRGRT